DRVEARVVRDVRVGGRVAIPAGARALGSVVVVERGGKMRERARLGIRFHTLALADGTRLPITTETIYRYGDAPGNSSAAKNRGARFRHGRSLVSITAGLEPLFADVNTVQCPDEPPPHSISTTRTIHLNL